jgi:hypothetical protein
VRLFSIMALKRERERERDGKQKLLCYAKEAGGLPTSRSIYADLQSGAGWRKHGSCLVSSLAARRARGGKSKAETKALSINPHQPRPPLAPHPRISILYFSSRQIISLSLLLRNAGCLAGWLRRTLQYHSSSPWRSDRPPDFCAHSLLVCVRTPKSKCAPQKYASAGEKRRESGCKCLPRHKSALEKLLCVRVSA